MINNKSIYIPHIQFDIQIYIQVDLQINLQQVDLQVFFYSINRGKSIESTGWHFTNSILDVATNVLTVTLMHIRANTEVLTTAVDKC